MRETRLACMLSDEAAIQFFRVAPAHVALEQRKYPQAPHDLIIVAEPTTELTPCRGCGAHSSALQRYGQTSPRYVYDVPIRGQRVRIYFRLQRYRCTAGKCKTTSLHPLSGIDPRRRATERFVQHVEQEAFKINKTFVMVADDVGVSEQLVRNIFAWRRKHMRDPLLLLKRRFQLSKTAKGRNKQSEKEIVKEWLEQVPEIKVAYELKEEFCDLWELRDRREAEERYRAWAGRVEGLLPHPFGNILVSVKRWRREIFNYFKYHDGGHFKLTNAFAESANNVVKTAQRLGKGYRFWVIRAKVIHGGGFVTRRPPHPLAAKRRRSRAVSAKGRKKKPRSAPDEENPDANVERLKRAYEERDQVKNLKLAKPEKSRSWVKRFGWVKGRRTPPT
jgi:transposase